MLFVLVLVIAVATVPLFGGRLGALREVRFRAAWLLWVALVLQVLLIALPGEQTWWRTAAYLLSYPLAIAFIVVNRYVPGLWIVGVGAFLNFLAIAANDGVMPASARALEVAGVTTSSGLYANSGLVADPRLLFLGDVLAVPARVPFANVYSVGDIVIMLGATYTIHRLAGSRLVSRRRAASG